MGFASVVGQVFLVIIFMIIFTQLYVTQHNQSQLQTELAKYQNSKLSDSNQIQLQLYSAHYNTTFNTTNLAIKNVGGTAIDINKSDLYIGDYKFSRNYTSLKFLPCIFVDGYRCGEIRFGDSANNEEASLLLLYHFNNDSYTGTNGVLDNYASTGASNDLTMTALSENTTARFDKAFYFNGASAFATRANTAQNAFTNTTSYTWSFWIYPTSYPNTGHTIVSKNAAATGYSIFIAPNGTLRMMSANAVTAFNCNRGIPLNQWTHVGIVYTGTAAGKIAFYINGTLTNSLAHNSVFRSDAVTYTLGRNDSTSTDYYSGILEELAQYNVAKTAQQIYALYVKGVYGGNKNMFDPGEILEIDAFRNLSTGTYTVTFASEEGARVSAQIRV